MIPVSSSYNLQGMSTLNFNNLLANANQTQTLPISALGNILQLHCNPPLTLQVNGPSPLIPVSSKENNNQEQINAFRNLFPNQSSYQNIPQQDQQCTNTSIKSFNQLLQEVLNTYQTQQDSLSHVTIKYNFLLNAMERLLFDVQNNVEYSLLALGISQTISKVKLNQLNQLNCTSLISNGVIPMMNQSHIFNNCSQTLTQQNDTIPIQTVIDLTNQRTRSDSLTIDKKSDVSHSESNISTNTNNSKPLKMTSLDKLDKLIDETVKKSTGKIHSNIENNPTNNLKSTTVYEQNQQPNIPDINTNMGNAIHQIIRQFYHNASSSINNNINGFTGNISTESTLPNIQQHVTRQKIDNIKTSSQQVTEIFSNSQMSFNGLGNRSNHSFILCNNLPASSIINGQQRESFVVSVNNSCKENSGSSVIENFNENNNATEDTESTSNREDDELCFAELDPTEVATRIRDILSLHSIGQRLFAKHVLNLSQGTVSELLSKPKPWSKLSEKGRDSYRKMNQWAQDASKVQELKSIAPRKGFSGHYAGMSPTTPIKEDHETQEKIKRILNDAKMAMASTNSQSTVEEEIFSCYSKSNSIDLPNDNSELTSAVCNSLQPIQKSGSNLMEFDIDQLQKKITAAINSTIIPSSSRFESLPQISTSTTYQQSPLILMNFANIVPCPSSLMVSSIQPSQSIFPNASSSSFNNNSEKSFNQNDFNSSNTQSLNEIDSIHLKNEMKIYNENGNDIDRSLENDIDKNLPKDQIDGLKNKTSKSITDLENLENFLKSFIGSIKLTGNCFQNEEINTTELVNVIKDHLTKNSISQRTFGCLLGLSQGTVSDILSRPKPWSMLTNKGREPYIRMLKYLLKPTYSKSTENCTNKINLSHNFLLESLPNSSSSPSSLDAALTFDQNISYDDKNEYINVVQDNNENEDCNISSSTEGHDYQSWDEDIQTINTYSSGSPISNLDQLQTENLKFNDPKEKIFSIANRILSIDTVELTNNVKEILNNNNFGQRVFGEVVLNLSQASVSDLLSKPKNWKQLSSKGREPYVRMYLWLHHQDRLKILCKTTEIKKGEIIIKETSENENIKRIITVNDPNNSYISTSLNKPKTIPKRTRVIFTEIQKSELKKLFEKYPYPKQDQLSDISKNLNLTITSVGNWFHNQRIKNRSEKKHLNQSTLHVVKMETLSGESEINSEKSLPMNIDDIFDGSDSDNSISAPHLYPESNLQEYSSINEGYQERNEDDEYYTINSSTATLAGSNKRKRTNPIKLEMVLNKSTPKDNEDHYIVNDEIEHKSKENLFTIKVPKLEHTSK